MNIGLAMFLVFIVLLALKVPIAYAMIITTTFTIFVYGVGQPTMLVQTVYSATESFTLVAVPMFVVSGELMLQGGLSRRLIDFGMSIFGGINGALGTVTVFTCAIFAALSGSGPATAAAIGAIMIPEMVKDGYDKGYSAVLAAAGGCLGPIIPPSICFVLYASIANVSIGDLFIAGVIPGILMAVCLITYVQISSKRNGFGGKRADFKFSFKSVWIAFKDAFWALLVPVIILGGIYGGVFTPTEAAVVACDYALIVGLFVYREFKLKDVIPILTGAAITAGVALCLVGCATTFARMLTLQRVPTSIAAAVFGITDNKIVILLLINLVLFIAGMFIETIAAMLIMTPLLLSLTAQLGVDPVHLGVFMVMNLVIGMVTPPMGVNLFITGRIADIGLEKMFKWVIPMVASLVVALLLVTYIPALSLWLPSLTK